MKNVTGTAPNNVYSRLNTGLTLMRAAHHRLLVSAVVASIMGCSNGTEPPRELRLVAVTDVNVTGTVGEIVQPGPVVRVIDADGDPVSGITLQFELPNWSVGRGSIGSPLVATDDRGHATMGTWTLGTVTSTYSLSAAVNGVVGIVFKADAKPGPVAELEILSGDRQTANTNSALAAPLRVRVRDRYGNRIVGVPVVFRATQGNGSIDEATSLSDANGVASSGTWILGASGGTQRVEAAVGGVQTVFTAIACDVVCQRSQLVFVRNGNLYLTNLVGSVVALTSSGTDYQPAWSPDGSQIAFARSNGSSVSWGDIYVMNADGSNTTLIAPSYQAPAWSPDGRTLAMTRGDCASQVCDLALLDLTSAGSVPVNIATRAAQPSWSPDGRRLAYVSLSGGNGHHELRIIDIDGTNTVVLSPRDAGSLFHPSWSPDGRSILFTKCSLGACEAYVAPVDGSPIRKITNVYYVSSAVWSPDGSMIALTVWTDAHDSLLWYFHTDSNEHIRILFDGYDPAWRPHAAESSATRAAARTR